MKAIEQLKNTLIQENDLYGQVLKLEMEKTNIIRKGKVKELELITKKEQQFITSMGTFERIRRSIFTNTAELLGVEELNGLSEILLYMEDEAMINEIDELRNEILKKIDEIKEVNQLNEKLMEQHLDYIHYNIELMTNQAHNDHSYGNSNQRKDKNKSNLFDARI